MSASGAVANKSLDQNTSEQNPAKKIGSSFADILFRKGTGFIAFIVAIALIAIMISLIIDGWQAIHTFGWKFLVTSTWDPVTNEYGALVFIVGTLVSSAIAMVIAVPVSFGIALFISELSPNWMRGPISATIELLAAIPSIIYGMWGLLVFAPRFANIEPWINNNLGAVPGIGILFQGPPMGIGMLTAGIVLAIMIIPFIASIMRDVFLITPPPLKESAYALGATTWEVARNVILPYTRTAVTGGIFLGLGRALGETMAVTFIIGNANNLSASLLMPGASIASVIANEFTEATTSLYKSSLLALGLVLFVITVIVLALAKLLLMRLESSQEGKKS
ncbi:phosphate transporter subunit; membrane component of ABC superfamily [Thiomonas arsenitoxydans]|uniref:Phosphate transport system permease protein n=1 Tax=Thiomonas arsenitoxydans (strain DSM 22701 / CIP 110005 / 3As) TaxID=426114 RepID=D6CU26_THIA3|nr:phosphate ABC transporter permease subunit PstC [Thiomonas arsenitoxydans]CQR41287.1 phosphate transporter subunit; membrane component of ABC superfamily [Thiomonas sp. CB3]CAZ88795.1 Phosphate transport system permease protein pstC [Thiomonas arsenitoxydans]CQR26330.1 phosphate transporter subunit; membrane component of ABC superfamily [Thiomonas arsenitoxydans]CQR28366.1 phosphate transporter subunit; membrane component of ABC superfamily [Thiomonas arsenitoxydans]CQR35249.1 phosphate tra